MSEIKESSACPCCAGKETDIAETAVPETGPEEGLDNAMAKHDGCGCHHKDRSPEELKALLHRLNRIEGQIRGIRKMVESDVYCTDILVQAAATKSALNGFTRELIEQHLGTCVAQDLKDGGTEKLKEFMWIMNKLM